MAYAAVRTDCVLLLHMHPDDQSCMNAVRAPASALLGVGGCWV
jgi:hypothetical protein